MNSRFGWFVGALAGAAFVLGCRTATDDAAPRSSTTDDVRVAQDAPQEPRPAPRPAANTAPQQPATGEPDFLPNAFPPIVPDTTWHADAWLSGDCLRCHETGVGDAPQVRHAGMPSILLTAKCRTCHVFVPGAAPRPRQAPVTDDGFESYAFPPMMPASEYHANAWSRADCLLCHENGVKGAPRIVHAGMSPRLLEAKCRTCHVQVRAIDVGAR